MARFGRILIMEIMEIEMDAKIMDAAIMAASIIIIIAGAAKEHIEAEHTAAEPACAIVQALFVAKRFCIVIWANSFLRRSLDGSYFSRAKEESQWGNEDKVN